MGTHDRYLSFFITIVLFLIASWQLTAFGQQTVTSATLSGNVTDFNGALINGASVTAANLDHNQSQTAISDQDGRFRFPSLTVGTYRLAIECNGFSTLTKQLTLTVGQTLQLQIKLGVKEVVENVDVTQGEAAVVETARTQVAETLTSREIDSMPLNGRNYLDLAALTPAVTRTNPVANQRFPETSAVPGTGISITGQRFINNGFVVDGLSANDDAADLPATSYSQEVIREFEVVTSGGIAQFGRASGGFVNIITHSGTNDLRGRVYGYLRNQRFDARNPLAPTKDPLTQAQYGFTLGGPLRKDQTFFFTNFEQTRLQNTTVITTSPQNVGAINNKLAAIGYQGPRLTTGLVPTGYDTTNFLVRVDHQLSSLNELAARYSVYNINSINSRSVGGLNDASRGTALTDTDQIFAITDVATLSSTRINELRFQYMNSKLDAPLNDTIGPAVNISGVANFGSATVSPTQRDLNTFQILDTFSFDYSNHSLKIGGELLLDRVNITFPGAIQGSYSFSSLPNFLLGRYTTFQQAFGATSQFQSNPNFGFFVQDELRVSKQLTINAGLRYDAQFLPSIRMDGNNFAPRIGLAYASRDYKTVVRAAWGIFFDRIPLRATSNALQRDGSKYKVAVLSFDQPNAPAFPAVLPGFPSDLLVSITTIDPAIENSYNQQGSLQLERDLGASTSLSVGYLFTRGQHLILSRNVNVPRSSSASVPNLGRPDPHFANVSRFESSGDSDYNALTVSLNRRFSKWFGGRVSYTLSKAIDNAGNAFFFTPQDNLNLRDERGLSDNDQRHRLTLSGTISAPHETSATTLRKLMNDIQLSYIFTYNSRLPFNIVTGNDRNFDTNLNDRPAGVGRNTGSGFNFASLDLRLSRHFQVRDRLGLDLLVEGFNVLNRANLQLPINVFGTGTVPRSGFGEPTAAADPRQLQFGLRLSF